MNTFQTIVLSGGGSKGAFGLGVLLALEKFHKERAKNVTKIFCGTSVGALNATLAAQGDLDKLRQLYSSITTKDILGTSDSSVGSFKMLRALHRKPFHYFNNDALRATIQKYVNYASLQNSHLLICATNFSTGDLETFYISRLVDEFLEQEKKHPEDGQRMLNYRRIESQEDLVNALLASTAIPFYFPPVKIGKHLFVDGGVGNNTPLRQAAYICRFIGCKPNVNIEPILCVINDPSRFTIDDIDSSDMFGVIRRTMDIFHNELVRDSHISWERINTDVRRSQERENVLSSHIEGIEELAPDRKEDLKERFSEALKATSTSAPKRDLPLLVVQPNHSLVDNVLHFDPRQAKALKQHGAEKCLELLKMKGMISHNNFTRWNEQID